MRATHTPGPWWLQAGHGCVHIGGPTIDKQIALVMTCDAIGVANARLISRAPEMLATLRDVLDWYAHSTDADGDMPPELHARLIRAVGGEVAA